MKTIVYTNAQLRSILNGLGYTTQDDTNDSTFPLSMDSHPLTDTHLVQAIQKFQIDHQIKVTGAVDSSTLAVIQTVMKDLIRDLNRANNTGTFLNHPLYNAAMIAAVKLVQQRLPADGIASHWVRDALANRQQDLQPLPAPPQNPAHAIFLHHGDGDW